MSDNPNAQGVQEYSSDKLPILSGESGYFKNIGLIGLNPSEYEVEMISPCGVYEITKK